MGQPDDGPAIIPRRYEVMIAVRVGASACILALPTHSLHEARDMEKDKKETLQADRDRDGSGDVRARQNCDTSAGAVFS
jgi:hypothetical protein